MTDDDRAENHGEDEGEWLGVDTFRLEDAPDGVAEPNTHHEVHVVEALYGHPEQRLYSHLLLTPGQKVPTTEIDEETWDLVGVASVKSWEEANRGQPGEPRAVYHAPDEAAWGTVTLTEYESPVGGPTIECPECGKGDAESWDTDDRDEALVCGVCGYRPRKQYRDQIRETLEATQEDSDT